MNEETGIAETITTSEDRRRPRAMMPYIVLWATCFVCVIFALFELAQQG